MTAVDVERNLLFGLRALQSGLIDRGQLLAALRSWMLDQGRPLADHLSGLRDPDDEQRARVDRLVAQQLNDPGNEAERGMISILASLLRHESLAGGVEPDLHETLAQPNPGATSDQPNGEPGRAAGAAVGSPGTGGQRFQVLRLHKRGGLGVVYEALDTELNRMVALKQMRDPSASDPDIWRRFLLEAEINGGLEHPGIVPVYSLGTDEGGRPYYAMRFIEGDSLKEAIERFRAESASTEDPGRRSLGLRQLLRRFTDVCNAIEYAHSRDVLHRDIKPANIIVGRYGETLIVDWGLAKRMGGAGSDSAADKRAPRLAPDCLGAGTLTGDVLGTPGYMSPEQADGRLDRLGPRTDVYGLGATLYAILTGKPPFEGQDPSLVLPLVRAGNFPRPRRVDPSVPAALEAICLKAMALDPAGRYATPRELGEDIERWLADEPVRAYPEPLPARAMRWVRRRKQWVAAAAAMLILTVLGLAMFNWRIGREQARTADQLAMTRDALRELLTVSGTNLAFVPNTENLREYLAGLVLERYQQLEDRFPTDPGVRLEKAQVFRVIGGIGRFTGQFAKSQGSYAKAIALLTTLCRDDPGHKECRRWLAEAFLERGELNHMNGRTLDAEADLRQAIGHADALESPTRTPPCRRAKGSALINLSEILLLQARPAEARTSAEGAVDLLRPLAGPDAMPGSTTRDRWLLAMALADRGAASGEAGDRDRAAQDLDEAARVAGSVAREDEAYDDAQFQLACIANQRGELLGKDPSSLAESERSFEQASQILVRLIAGHRLIPHYREEMAVTLCGRAAVRLAGARITEAQRDCEAARDHLAWLVGEQTRKGAPENPRYLSLLGQVLAGQSRIHLLQGRSAEGRQARAEAVARLSRAVELDPARATDRGRLEAIKAGPAQPGE
jgi:tetratricopeptide (TPR) repeat protein/tRNA A-37 threonylcarbamoyl transferase component Bud32